MTQRAWKQEVVVVEQGHELTASGLDSVVGRRDDVAVRLALDHPDAWVSVSGFAQDLENVRARTSGRRPGSVPSS